MRSWMIGILLGVLVGGQLPWLMPWEYLFVPALLLTGVRRWAWRSLGGLLLGLSLLAFHGQGLLDSRLPDQCTGKRFGLWGTVVSLPRVSNIDDERSRQRFEFRVEGMQTPEPACAGLRKVLLSWYGQAPILPGQRWRFQARLRRPWGLENEGSFNIQAWFAQTGIDAVGSASERGAQLLGTGTGQGLNRYRYQISQALLAAGISANSSAVLRAVTVADKSGIDHSLWSLFQRFGINHLLVISGLHVGMVAGLGYLMGLGLNRGFRWGSFPVGEIFALLFAALYTGMAGFSVATQRALYMLTCFMCARALGRHSGAGGKLLIAAVIVLLLNPMAPLGSGFWLSFTAVTALLWLSQWRGDMSKRLATVTAHVYMGLLMLPLGGFWFGVGSWMSAPANLLMVPLIGLYVVPLALAGAVLSVLGSSYAPTLWQWAAVPLDMLFRLEMFSQGSAGTLHLSAGLAVMSLAMLGLALLVVPGLGRRRLLLGLFCLPLFLPFTAVQKPPVLTVMDVGQGTAVLFRAGARSLLYDTGGGNPAGANLAQSVVLPLLRSRGVRELDYLVVSHGDLDHSAGLDDILAALPVARVWIGGGQLARPNSRTCRAGLAWQWPDGTRFQFLSPADTGGLSDNNGSCVLQIESGSHRILLAGDVEEAQERELIRYWQHELASDLLLVGHHGSKTSTSQSWLNRVDPAVAVINNAYGNQFGHPALQVLQRLETQGVAVLQTTHQGAIDIELPRAGPWVITARREGIKPWWM